VTPAPQLLRSAWLLCGDRPLAEDLVQETPAKVYVREMPLLLTRAADAVPVDVAALSAGYGPCQQVGDARVLTESQGGPIALHAATVWRHGYEIGILSCNAGPADTPNPALDGKRLTTVSATPPLGLPALVAAASSDAWFD
jgi:hypothetical protein